MQNPDFEKEFQEWLEALENLLISDGKEYTEELLRALYTEARLKGIQIPELDNPPFKNTVHSDEEHPYPGNLEYEEKIRQFIRWNSLLTVLKANKEAALGGHI